MDSGGSADSLRIIAPPEEPIHRVARREYNPFAPTPWQLVSGDGTFGNRFDDPSKADGRPESDRFRMIYCATERAAAFGETIARFLPPLRLLAADIGGDDESILEAQRAGLLDPEYPRRGVVPESWRILRQLGQTNLDPALSFVDLAVGENLHHLRSALATLASTLGSANFDLSAVTGPQRGLTQACARYVYDQIDETGQPRYAGIRYLSRLNAEWECWAIFADRMRHTPGLPTSIFPDDPGLLEAASLLGLTIESFEGHYIRPWR